MGECPVDGSWWRSGLGQRQVLELGGESGDLGLVAGWTEGVAGLGESGSLGCGEEMFAAARRCKGFWAVSWRLVILAPTLVRVVCFCWVRSRLV